jgi:hypothetical protein
MIAECIPVATAWVGVIWCPVGTRDITSSQTHLLLVVFDKSAQANNRGLEIVKYAACKLTGAIKIDNANQPALSVAIKSSVERASTANSIRERLLQSVSIGVSNKTRIRRPLKLKRQTKVKRKSKVFDATLVKGADKGIPELTAERVDSVHGADNGTDAVKG